MAIARRSLPRVSAQTIAGMLVAAIVGVLVLYPIFFLLQAALDVGDPDVRPPTAYGLGNFVAHGPLRAASWATPSPCRSRRRRWR